MVGLMQIMIWLFCAYLVFKGIEIFQIAFVSSPSKSRSIGIVIGIVCILGAVCIAGGAGLLTELQVQGISGNMPKFP